MIWPLPRPTAFAAVLVAVGTGAGVLAGCTSSGPSATPSNSASGPAVIRSDAPSSSVSVGPSASPASCPATYAAPDLDRPRMSLAFTIAADHEHVTGREQVAFIPDKPITELVFRLTSDSPAPASGTLTSTTVRSARADHGGGAFTVSRAGAATGTQGGLLHIPFASTVPVGTRVTATISFTLTVGRIAPQAFPRVGRVSGFTYFGSGAPLLAWQRGYGWHTENLVGYPAETATSEAMGVDLSVTAPAADTVIMSGDPARPAGVAGSAPTRTWRSHLDTARDISVAAGPFAVSDTTVGGVRLRVGAPSTLSRDALVPKFTRAIEKLSARFGPYPFPSLSVARLPLSGGGIEYPSSILLLDDSRLVAVHETAHQWFYAMVGNSQALHPWLDEAFAQYAEELVDGTPSHLQDLTSAQPVDASIASYRGDSSSYYFATYDKGSAALEAARAAAGARKWDAALRCYIAANAWQIVTPSDLEKAMAALPAAVSVLRKAGAVP